MGNTHTSPKTKSNYFRIKRAVVSKKSPQKSFDRTQPICIPCLSVKDEPDDVLPIVAEEVEAADLEIESPMKRIRLTPKRLFQRLARFSPSKYGEYSPTNEEEFDKRPRACTITSCTTVIDNSLPTVFRWNNGGSNVSIAGSFTDWKPIPMAKSEENFISILGLEEGEHQYRFLVDGEWKHDVEQPLVNGERSCINKITVKKSDFEVFDALAIDSPNGSYPKSCPPSPPGHYCRIPFVQMSAGPPTLPPHLSQIILNMDGPSPKETTMLPEPSHFMLNHMYALSIQDNVIVLSTIHRFRRRFITTILYTPLSKE